MAAAEPERKRRMEVEAGGGDPAVADEEDEEERWVGPLPGEAAQAKKRRGKGRSGALLRLGSGGWDRLQASPGGSGRGVRAAVGSPCPEAVSRK